MADLTQQETEVNAAKAAMEAAIAFFNGLPAFIQSKIDAAIANGATAAQLEPLTSAVDSLAADTATLTADLAAATPAPAAPAAAPAAPATGQ